MRAMHGGYVTLMDHADLPRLSHRATGKVPWISATVIGLVGAVAWWVPSYPPGHWEAIVAWLVWLIAALVSGAVAYFLGARGKTVALASALAAVVTFAAWPVIYFVVVVIVLIIEVLTGS
jgi:hypothetical protein